MLLLDATLPSLRRARSALAALDHEAVFARHTDFPVARSLSEFGAGAPLRDRFPSAEALYEALRAEDPTVLAFAVQLLESFDAPAAVALAAEMLRTSSPRETPPDVHARRSAALVVDAHFRELALDELVAWVAAGRLSPPRDLARHPALAAPRDRLALVRRLDDTAMHPAHASALRNTLLQSLVAEHDRQTLDWLIASWADPAGAFAVGAGQWLLLSGDLPALRRMAELGGAELAAASPERRHQIVRAIIDAGDAERLHLHVLPLLAPSEADDASRLAIQTLLGQLADGIRRGRVPRDDARLAAATQALLAIGAFKGLAKALLSAMDQAVVKAVGSAPKGAGKAARRPQLTPPSEAASTPLLRPDHHPRYQAGEHVAVWQSLRGLSSSGHDQALKTDVRAVADAAMTRFVASVEAIIAVLRRARYAFAAETPIAPPRPDAPARIAALAKLIGPVAPAVEAFYRHCDGVDLSQDLERPIRATKLFAPGVLDELGRCDPLMVVSLGALEADAKAIAKRNRARAPALHEPLWPYLAPTPASKGMGDDIADDTPVRLVGVLGADGLVGDGQGAPIGFVDWLRRFVAAGGFLGLATSDDGAVFRAGVIAF